MAESLLSFSEVLLFGRVVDELLIEPKKPTVDETVRLATKKKIIILNNLTKRIDGVKVEVGDKILVRKNNDESEDGIYPVVDNAGNPKLGARSTIAKDTTVEVKEGKKFDGFIAVQTKAPAGKQKFRWIYPRHRGNNNHLFRQFGEDAAFARIYGFSYEGTYYELPEPVMFLVHGDGEDAFAASGVRSRSPLDPSLSGVAAADYQVADEIRVWPYDKADYTMRMDVMTGMFEQVLLDIYFGFDSPAISGAKVSGAKVSGAKVSGAKVSGAKVSGAKARGSGD